MGVTDDDFDWLKDYNGLPEDVVLRQVTPAKILKRRRRFVQVPMDWIEALKGAHGQTYRVALFLLHLHWRGGGEPVKLANGMLAMDGVPPTSKRRALADLERRGLITVERRPHKSPLIKLRL
jgi:hypothetical protein